MNAPSRPAEFSASSDAWRLAALSMMSREQLNALLAHDSAEAAQWIEAAAQCGVVEAQLLLGRKLLETDAHAAFEWFARASASGDADALNMLGRCHENGWGTAQDFSRAATRYRHAANKGDAWAQYNLGHLLLDGNGVTRNRDEAFAWYFRAAQQGHARAMNLVARCFEEGWGVETDTRAARNWYRNSAHGGYFRGAYNYATILAGEGCITAAAMWFERAVQGAADPSRTNIVNALMQRRETIFVNLASRLAASSHSRQRVAVNICPA
jgi:TPR repeat protein